MVQAPIDECGDLTDVAAVQREGPKIGTGFCHYKGGGQAVSSCVCDEWLDATINLGARNLFLWMPGSEYPGMDPETNVIGRCNGGLDCNFLQSTEGWAIPIPRRFTLSTRVTF